MSESFLAIVNPAAGGRSCGRKAPALLSRLQACGIPLEVYETKTKGDASRKVREAYAQGQRKFISVGGDGTAFEVINGLFPEAYTKGTRPTIAFLPLGTGNSFLRDFTRNGVEDTVNALREKRTTICDVVQVKHRQGLLHYINIFSLGFMADVAALRNRKLKAFGEFAYVLGVLAEVTRLRTNRFPMQTDNGTAVTEPTTFVAINNSKYTGGRMMVAPNADTGDGLANLIWVDRVNRLDLLKTFPMVYNGKHAHHPAFHEKQIRKMDFDLPGDVEAMVDGESIRLHPEHLEVLPKAFEVHA